ncbi:MAG: hypothetical protein JST16_02845 [Bdellovibrionales bacterium]|nr:hypothetical protein [Bdellovibrionales bacterium]
MQILGIRLPKILDLLGTALVGESKDVAPPGNFWDEHDLMMATFIANEKSKQHFKAQKERALLLRNQNCGGRDGCL